MKIVRDKKDSVAHVVFLVLLDLQDQKEVLEVKETLVSLVQKDQLDHLVLLGIALLVDKIKALKEPGEHQEIVEHQEQQGLLETKVSKEDWDCA